MKEYLLKLQIRGKMLLDDSGQDLIEYALVVALICFAATVGMGSIANSINDAFNTLGSKLTSAVNSSTK